MEYYTQWEDGGPDSLNKSVDLHKDCDTAAVDGTVRTGFCSLNRCSSTDRGGSLYAWLHSFYRGGGLHSHQRSTYSSGTTVPGWSALWRVNPVWFLFLYPICQRSQVPFWEMGLNTASGK
ncbi:hypothetical protein QTP70_034588, partial [Hemibagrus guttatus]